MLLGVVSDTHGNIRRTVQAVELLQDRGVEAVLHCGDVGSPGIVELFAAWPTHFVAGNCDAREDLGAEVRAASQNWHDLFGEITLSNRRIALLHSHMQGKLVECEASGQYDLVCYGHTHRYETHRIGETVILNPGALHRAHPPTIAIVDLASMQVEHVEIAA
jgi:uncharacterized protein